MVTHNGGMAVEVVGHENSNFTRTQTNLVIQRARDKLLDAQFEYRDRGEEPPTEISIPLPSKENFVLEATPSTSKPIIDHFIR